MGVSPVSEEEFISVLENVIRLEKDFPKRLAAYIIENEAYPAVLRVVCHPKHKIAFRAAWGLEHAWMAQPLRFSPYIKDFVCSFPEISDESVRRSYGKMMIGMLRRREFIPAGEEAETIAETVCGWISDPGAKIAGRINGIEILFLLADRVEWVPDILEDIVQREMLNPSPGILSRIRKLKNASD